MSCDEAGASTSNISAVDPMAAHEAYLTERRAYVDSIQKSAEQFDRWVLTLSGGALALSMTFLSDMAPPGQRAHLWLLVVGWSGFLGSALCTLGSLLASQKATRCAVDILDQKYLDGSETPNRWRGVTTALNATSMAGFGIGVAFLALFVLLNL